MLLCVLSLRVRLLRRHKTQSRIERSLRSVTRRPDVFGAACLTARTTLRPWISNTIPPSFRSTNVMYFSSYKRTVCFLRAEWWLSCLLLNDAKTSKSCTLMIHRISSSGERRCESHPPTASSLLLRLKRFGGEHIRKSRLLIKRGPPLPNHLPVWAVRGGLLCQ